ncbi:MAG: hypothetical protein DRN26_00530 [Thermoplasmata archaeon]|nr:MAG: hypothetical protein DRN26_00530 [Thermoplasmata archaeon]
MAGALALRIGKRPTELLRISESPLEDLLLDAAIIAQVTAEQEEPGSLKEEIKRKRRRLWAKKCQLEKLEYS